MPRKKINSGQSSILKNTSERMRKYFPEGYKRVFFHPLFSKSDVVNNSNYIPDEDLEKKIDTVIQSGESQFAYLIGYKGIGKTTILKHFFNYTGKEILLENNCLYFTKYVWNYYTLLEDVDLIKQLFHDLNSLLADKAELSSVDNREPLLEILRFSHSALIEHDESSNLSSIEHFQSHNGRIFEIRQFQLLLQKKNINSFVMVLDNIEDLVEAIRYKLIGQFIDTYKMLNDWNAFSEDYRPNIIMLISSSPDTYLNLNESINLPYRIVDCFIKKSSVINMDKYYSLKVKALPIEESLQWVNSLPYFIKVSQKFNGKYNQIILGLSNYNINTAMKIYANILSNETWMHNFGNKHTNSTNRFFDANSLHVNNITVIRSLACLEDEMFLGHKESPVCNLLYSTYNEDYSIVILYLMKRFYLSCGTNNDYGSVFIKKDQLIKQFSEIFHGIDNIEDKTEKCIQYLLNANVLAKSFKTIPEKNHTLGYNDRLYLTPRGITIWEMLTMDSVLLELFREDYYRMYQENDNNPFCSMTLLDGQQHELFLDLIRMVKEISEHEKVYYNAAVNNDTITALNAYFGNHSICYHLISGVLNSMTYSGIYNNPVVKASYESFIANLW